MIIKKKTYASFQTKHKAWRKAAAKMFKPAYDAIKKLPTKSTQDLDIKGVSVKLVTYKDEEHPKDKAKGVKEAVSAIKTALPIAIPHLEIHLTSSTWVATPETLTGSTPIQCIAHHVDADANNKATIFLTSAAHEPNPPAKPQVPLGGKPLKKGSKSYRAVHQSMARKRGIADYIYESQTFNKRSAMVSAVTIHEIGHILHQTQHPDAFWALNCSPSDYKQRPDYSLDLSPYASDSHCEYVAEFFTALVLGFTLTTSMRNHYNDLGGPQ